MQSALSTYQLTGLQESIEKIKPIEIGNSFTILKTSAPRLE